MKKVEFNKVQNDLTAWLDSGALVLEEYNMGPEKTDINAVNVEDIYNDYKGFKILTSGKVEDHLSYDDFRECLIESIPDFEKRDKGIYSLDYPNCDDTVSLILCVTLQNKKGTWGSFEKNFDDDQNWYHKDELVNRTPKMLY